MHNIEIDGVTRHTLQPCRDPPDHDKIDLMPAEIDENRRKLGLRCSWHGSPQRNRRTPGARPAAPQASATTSIGSVSDRRRPGCMPVRPARIGDLVQRLLRCELRYQNRELKETSADESKNDLSRLQKAEVSQHRDRKSTSLNSSHLQWLVFRRRTGRTLPDEEHPGTLHGLC